MTHSFIAYIDEAGDDGLGGRYRQPGGLGGPSHWLSLGAVVWRLSRDLEAVGWARDIQSRLPQQKKNRFLHFAKLDHQQRVMAVNALSGKPFRAITVLAYKPALDRARFAQKNRLYFYLCRYLVERISWLCRDLRPLTPEGDGRVKIVFARRGTMSYPEFQTYLVALKANHDPDIRINWAVIDIEAIEARDQPERFGLQIADLVTTGINSALEPDFYGNTEPRFARTLKGNIYCRNGNFLSYGTKLVPHDLVTGDIPHVSGFREIFTV